MAVRSTSYNPVDTKTRNGGPGRKVELPKVIPSSPIEARQRGLQAFPLEILTKSFLQVPGGDLAGIVVEADEKSKVEVSSDTISLFTLTRSKFLHVICRALQIIRFSTGH